MAHNNFMDKFRAFFGLRQEPPRNDFRNPIWSSDDEDDGDELYTRLQIKPFEETDELHQEFSRQMHEMLKSFGSMFGDFKSFLHDDSVDAFTITDLPPEHDDPENFGGNNIRDYYLKPGYHRRTEDPKEDIDLDGKISSHEIAGLLNQKKNGHSSGAITPFNGNLVPGHSFCQTIITTSVTKPDGTIETRRIVKNGNETIEETTTTTESRSPVNPGLDPMSNPGLIYSNVMSELSSLFRNFY